MTIRRVMLIGILLLGALLWLGNGSPYALAQDGQSSSPPGEAADDFELESLDDELFEGLDDGEDIQLDSEGEPLSDEELGDEVDPATRIGHLMRRVQQLLQEQDLSQPTRDGQKEIVRQLEEWLKQLEKQRKKSQQQKPNQQSKPKPGAKPNRGDPKPSGGSSQSGQPAESASQTPAQQGESDKEIHERKLEKVEFDQIRGSVEEFWGDLPEKERQLLRQMADTELLPEYASLIRRYFRRLAEDKQGRR